MAYTNISKPTGPNYTQINTAKPTYDESAISYDDSNFFYDGSDPNLYINIAKPTIPSYTNIAKPT